MSGASPARRYYHGGASDGRTSSVMCELKWRELHCHAIPLGGGVYSIMPAIRTEGDGDESAGAPFYEQVEFHGRRIS